MRNIAYRAWKGEAKLYFDKAYKDVQVGVTKRADVVDKMMCEAHKAAVPDTPHIHIAIMATDPAQQGKGYGAQLLRAVIRVADAAGLPVYVDTCGARTRAFYEHFGFEHRATYTLQVTPDAKWPPTPADGEWPPYEELHAFVRPAGSAGGGKAPAGRKVAPDPSAE